MAQLSTVADYLADARVLLQDADGDRYTDAELIRALNIGLMEARRLRSDLFIATPSAVPIYTTSGQTVDFDLQYRASLLYYVVGMASLRDAEDVQDKRAAALMGRFTAQLLSVAA